MKIVAILSMLSMEQEATEVYGQEKRFEEKSAA